MYISDSISSFRVDDNNSIVLSAANIVLPQKFEIPLYILCSPVLSTNLVANAKSIIE